MHRGKDSDYHKANTLIHTFRAVLEFLVHLTSIGAPDGNTRTH